MTHDPRFLPPAHGPVAQGQPDAGPWQQWMEAAPVPLCVTEGAQVLWANRACAYLLGEAVPDTFQPRPLSQWLGAAAQEALQAAAASDAPTDAVTSVSLRLNRRDGAPRDVEVLLTHLRAPGHHLVLVALHDVTLRASELRQLLRSRRTLRELSASLVEAREEERRHIARELHDELGQRLTALKLEMSACAMQHQVQPSAPVFRTLDDKVAAVRRIAADLRPPMLDDLGPVAAIDWLCQQHQTRTGLQIQVRIEVPPERLPPALATPVYRIVQEALTNIARHAQASQAQVHLFVRSGHLVISVQDDGVGFGAGPQRPAGSFGLIGIRERALMLGGTVWLGRGEWGGAHLEVHLPLQALPPGTPPAPRAGQAPGYLDSSFGDLPT